MDKLQELKDHVAKLFAAATDPEIIKNAAVVDQKIKEVEEEQKKQQEDYTKLLGDYKDVVLHSSFKPNEQVDNNTGAPSGTFDADAAFAKFFLGGNE